MSIQKFKNKTGLILILLPIMFTAQSCNLFSLSSDKSGSGSQGVFLSNDSGNTWHEANKLSPEGSMSKAEVFHLFIEPNQPKNLLMSGLKNGLFASDNYAESWFRILPGYTVYSSYISRSENNIIYVAGAYGSTGAIAKSEDRGGTWKHIYRDPSGKGMVTSMAVNPNRENIIFAGLSSGTILLSVDFGERWTAVGTFSSPVRRLVVVADGRGTVYGASRYDGMIRSVDGGNTWTTHKVQTGRVEYNDLAIDPQNTSVLYLGTSAGLFHSTDFGDSWTKVATIPTSPKGDDVSAIAINPQNSRQIFIGIFSTLLRSDNQGQTWRTVELPTQRKIFNIAIDPSEPNRIYAGLR